MNIKVHICALKRENYNCNKNANTIGSKTNFRIEIPVAVYCAVCSVHCILYCVHSTELSAVYNYRSH